MSSQNQDTINAMNLSPDTKKMILEAMEKFDIFFDSLGNNNDSSSKRKIPRIMISSIATNIHKHQKITDTPLHSTITELDDLFESYYKDPKSVMQTLKKQTSQLTNEDAKIMSDIKSGIHDFIDKNKGLLGKEQYSQSLIFINDDYKNSIAHLPKGFSVDKLKASVHKFLAESDLKMQYAEFVQKHPEHQIKNSGPSPHTQNIKSS